MTHKDLVNIGAKWLYNKGYSVVLKEITTSAHEQPDVIGFCPTGLSFLLEIKTSRADFLADKRKYFRRCPEMGMGAYRSFVCPSKLITPDELPLNWGLIYVNNGKPRQIVKPTLFTKFYLHGEQTLLVSFARRIIDNFEYKKYAHFPEN